jgi:UDP-glucose 4-epimerase
VTPQFQAERAINPVPRRLAGTAEARRQIGFTAELPLEEGLADLVAWWRKALAPAAELA